MQYQGLKDKISCIHFHKISRKNLHDEIDVRNQKKLYITHFLYGKYTLVIIGATQSLSWAIRDFWLIFLIKYILLIIWVTALQYLPV